MKSPKNEWDTDLLTGLFNRDYGIEALRRLVDEANVLRTVRPSRIIFSEGWIGVIFVDIYKLKLPHDNYGHVPIDGVICDVGEAIKQLANENDIACRYGGDEFLIIMPGVSEEEVKNRAAKLRESAAQIRVIVGGQPREHITLSIGVAHYPTIYESASNSKLHGTEALMRAVDEDLERDRIRNSGSFVHL